MKVQKRYIALFLVLISFSIFLHKCHKDYYREYEIVKSELEKIKDIEILNIDGNSDLTLEDIYATIKIKSGDTLMIYSLSKANFVKTNSISLSRLNSFEFHSTGCVSAGHWAGGSLDIGENSAYSDIQKLNLKNLQDVITHIDDLKRLIDKISVHPKFDTLKSHDGTVYFQKYDLHQVPNTRELKWADCP